MAPARIPEIKETIRGLELATARTLAQRALALESAEEVRALVSAGEESRDGAVPVHGAAGC
jgi:phosphoenolpyruvate-protein kinase (PTS system EI component)